MKWMLKLSLFSLVFAVAVFAEQAPDHAGAPTGGAPVAQGDQGQAPIDELAVYNERYNQCLNERLSKQRQKSPSATELALIKALTAKQ